LSITQKAPRSSRRLVASSTAATSSSAAATGERRARRSLGIARASIPAKRSARAGDA